MAGIRRPARNKTDLLLPPNSDENIVPFYLIGNDLTVHLIEATGGLSNSAVAISQLDRFVEFIKRASSHFRHKLTER